MASYSRCLSRKSFGISTRELDVEDLGALERVTVRFAIERPGQRRAQIKQIIASTTFERERTGRGHIERIHGQSALQRCKPGNVQGLRPVGIGRLGPKGPSA